MVALLYIENLKKEISFIRYYDISKKKMKFC